MENTLELKSNKWQSNQPDPDVQMKELFRNYNVSTELIKRTTNQKELIDLILREYIDRFDEIPGVDLVNMGNTLNERIPVQEKLRSLVLFASQAIMLKEKSEIFKELETSNKRLKETTVKLNQNNIQLKEMNQQYLNMLGFVSHELRSPLISILGFAELLEEGILGPLNGEQRKASKVIMRSSNSLIEMIQNYLDLAKIEQGEMTLDKKAVDLYQDILLQILEEMEEQFQKKEVSLFVEGELEAASVFCDVRLMRVVLINLLSNAVKYGEHDGNLCVRFVRHESHLQVTVENSGEGVKKQELKKIFQKFSQMSKNKKGSYRSSGLGLFNSKFIIKKHVGSIWAESEFGKWFHVHFTLPFSEI